VCKSQEYISEENAEKNFEKYPKALE